MGQIRRYKANKEVMEKAAEVYTRLKSRVLGPKIEAIQKATRTGTEKERAEVEKAEEALAGEEAPTERAGRWDRGFPQIKTLVKLCGAPGDHVRAHAPWHVGLRVRAQAR